VYWYRTDHARSYIERKKLVITLGHSKDGTPTGAGYLVPRKAYFVLYAKVPDYYLSHAQWETMTDREVGFLGEAIIDVLIEHRIVDFKAGRATMVRSQAAQHSAVDLEMRWLEPFLIEGKTERVKSDNLFIQSQEGGHRVHQVTEQGRVQERITNAPALEKDEVPF
jgi:hypothetical protein